MYMYMYKGGIQLQKKHAEGRDKFLVCMLYLWYPPSYGIPQPASCGECGECGDSTLSLCVFPSCVDWLSWEKDIKGCGMLFKDPCSKVCTCVLMFSPSVYT